jgi:hypothetical protein
MGVEFAKEVGEQAVIVELKFRADSHLAITLTGLSPVSCWVEMRLHASDANTLSSVSTGFRGQSVVFRRISDVLTQTVSYQI